MLIVLKYSELLLNKVAVATPAERQRFHLAQLGLALDGEHVASLVAGYSDPTFTVLEARSALTGNSYTVRFAPGAEHVVQLDHPRGTYRVRVLGPGGLIYETPTKSKTPRSNRSTVELLEVLLDAPVYPGNSHSLREQPPASRGGYLYHTYGCASSPGSPYRPFSVSKLLRAFPGISQTEKLRVQSWRDMVLEPVPYATSWWETTSGLPDETDWTTIPVDRVALLLAALAEGVEGRSTYLPFEKFDRAAGYINIIDVDHLIRLCPALTSCRNQIAVLQGQPFPRPLSL